MNIIFLDIDGVLNHQFGGTTESERFGFAPDLLSNLRYVIDSVGDCKIVISSSWRHFKVEDRVDPVRPWREVLEEKLGCPGIIIGETPDVKAGRRGEEVKAWLDANKALKVANFVILDDCTSDIRPMFPNNVVDCELSSYAGLTMSKAKEAIWVLTNFGREKKMTDNTWFTSDTHFWHGNIIKYCNRPWHKSVDAEGLPVVDGADVQQMNEDLIARWNAVVGKDDIVWHLGDFCFGKKENVADVLSRLNGNVNLIMGNHDRHKMKFYYDAGFHRVYDHPVVLSNFFILSHAPLPYIQNGGVFANLFGHVHDSPAYKTWSKNSVCLCVERHGYRPISWKEIQEGLAKQNGVSAEEVGE